MKHLKRIQVFINRYYENIKLILLLIILSLVGYALLVAGSAIISGQEARHAQTLEIIESIERETDEQTDKINKQFQALCYLMIEVSGEEALRQLDPPLEEQCRDLAKEMRQQETDEEMSVSAPVQRPTQQSDTTQQNTQTPQSPRQAPQTEGTPRPTPTESQPVQEERGLVERLTRPLTDTVTGLLNIL